MNDDDDDDIHFKIGDDVRWSDNPYTIVDIKNDGVLLKQIFSIKVTLNGLVPIKDLKLER